jgi:hypothetical protein
MRGSVVTMPGHPSYRILPETSGGLPAIRDSDRFPVNLWRLFPTDQRAIDTTVTGDFVICPLETPRPGRLRLVRIDSATNLSQFIDND